MFRFMLCVNAAFIAGAVSMSYFLVQGIAENNIKDYHCTPITYHETLESAQEQVRAYQAKVATVHGIGVEK